jgi:predicted DNA-binding transcriptional regulator AlpA
VQDLLVNHRDDVDSTDPFPELLDIQQLAQLFRVDERTIYRRIDSGQFPPHVRGTRRPRLWSEAVVRCWINDGGQTPRAGARR